MQEKLQKKLQVKQNILQVIDIKGLTKYDFYKKTGITRGILDQNNGINEENLARFLAYFDDIDANWLVTGKGEMYKKEDKNTNNDSSYDNMRSIIEILDKTLLEKDKQIDRLLSIIEQHGL